MPVVRIFSYTDFSRLGGQIRLKHALPHPTREGYFLANESKMYGPFTRKEFDFLYRKGVLFRFTYFWEPRRKLWYEVKILRREEAPIPDPDEPISEQDEKTLEATLTQRVSDDSTEATQIAGLDPQAPAQPGNVSAICFDQVNLIKGVLPEFSRDLLTLFTEDPSTFPPFPDGTEVSLNLFNEASGKTAQAQARVCSSVREEDGWKLELEWTDYPAFFFSGCEGAVPGFTSG